MQNKTEWSEREFAAGSLSLWGRVYRDGACTDAPRPILALHGWMDNAMTYSGLAPLLDPVEFIALDLPGHGLSGHRPVGSRYHFVDYIADVCAVIQQVRNESGISQIDLMGHSLGAAVASIVAGVIPDEIGRLMLIEGLGPQTREASEAVVGHNAAIRRQRNARTRPLRTIPDIDTAVTARQMVGELSEASARCLVHRNLVTVEGGWRWRSDPRLRDPSALYLTEAVVRAHLEAIQAPVIVVRALNKDDAVSRQWIVDRLPCIQNLQLVELPGTHHLHLDDPQPVAAAINRFTQSTK